MVNIELMSGRLRGAPKGFRDFANQGFGALSPSSTSRRMCFTLKTLPEECCRNRQGSALLSSPVGSSNLGGRSEIVGARYHLDNTGHRVDRCRHHDRSAPDIGHLDSHTHIAEQPDTEGVSRRWDNSARKCRCHSRAHNIEPESGMVFRSALQAFQAEGRGGQPLH